MIGYLNLIHKIARDAEIARYLEHLKQRDKMKFKIFSDRKKETQKYLHLYDSPDGVRLSFVDENGLESEPGGSILTIGNDGLIRLHENLSPRHGLKVDSDGRPFVRCKD